MVASIMFYFTVILSNRFRKHGTFELLAIFLSVSASAFVTQNIKITFSSIIFAIASAKDFLNM